MQLSALDAVYLATYAAAGALFGVCRSLDACNWMVWLGLALLAFAPPLAELFLVCPERRATVVPIAGGAGARKLPIVYSPDYNITAGGLENLHPFDSRKYGRVFSGLQAAEIVKGMDDVFEPVMPTRKELLLVHSPLYLAKLHSALYLTTVLEVPIFFLPSWTLRRLVLDPMLLATGGSIMGARIALERGVCINLGGGYHHASGARGGGFCVYADITLAIRHLQRDHGSRVRKAMVIDLDAHQGNGHERDFLNDPDVFILDAYNPGIYPGDRHAEQAIGATVHVRPNHDDTHYLGAVDRALSAALDEFKPDFVVYNAGTDIMDGDPLGNLHISAQGVVMRDQLVFSRVLEREQPIPLLMVLSGGYQHSNAPCIAESIVNLSRRFRRYFSAR